MKVLSVRAFVREYAVPLGSAAVVVAGTVAAIGLADAATESDGLAAFDPDLTTDAASSRTPALTALARALTFVGDLPVMVSLTLLAAVLLWRRTRGRRAPALLLSAMAGSAVLTSVLKALVERKRPEVTFVLGPVDNGFAFPSGHTLNSTVFFVAVAGLVCVRLRSAGARLCVVIAGVLMSIGVGWSRVYLGYHWATDVLAGWTIAVTWLALLTLVAHFTCGHTASRREQ